MGGRRVRGAEGSALAIVLCPLGSGVRVLWGLQALAHGPWRPAESWGAGCSGLGLGGLCLAPPRGVAGAAGVKAPANLERTLLPGQLRGRVAAPGRERGGPACGTRPRLASPGLAAPAPALSLPRAGGRGAMDTSDGLFPSLVVVGHVLTLAAVWHWRRGRGRALEEPGKPWRSRGAPSRARGWGGALAAPPPARPGVPCASLFRANSRAWS